MVFVTLSCHYCKVLLFQNFAEEQTFEETNLDEQTTPLLSPTEETEPKPTDSIPCSINLASPTTADTDPSPAESNRNSQASSIETAGCSIEGRDLRCFRTSHSNQSLSMELKAADATKRCVIECENGQRIVAEHVIVTASLGKLMLHLTFFVCFLCTTLN